MPQALVCALMPEFDKDSGSRRVLDLIGMLQELGWTVTFVSHHPAVNPRYLQILQQRRVEAYCGSDAFFLRVLQSRRFEAVVFGLWHIAQPLIGITRENAPNAKIFVDSIDLHFLRNARGLITRAPRHRREGEVLDASFGKDMLAELNTYLSVDGVLTVSRKEADLINDLAATDGLAWPVPDSETPANPTVALKDRHGIVFAGYFKHEPNVGAVQYLCDEILPRMGERQLRRHPLYVIGDGLDPELQRELGARPGTRVTGWVPSVTPYFQQARLSVVPLLYGAGTKRKLLQSLMLGTPAVSTPVGAEGLPLRDGKEILIAQEPDDFAAAMNRLLEDDRLWERLSAKGQAAVAARHSRDAVRELLSDALTRVLPLDSARTARGVQPSRPSQQDDYMDAVARIVRVVQERLPSGSTVAVLSRGDDRLLEFASHRGLHFPQTESGAYTGSHPADSASALVHLDEVVQKGADYLLFPKTAFWWLGYYHDFSSYLRQTAERVVEDECCLIFKLRSVAQAENLQPGRQRSDNGNRDCHGGAVTTNGVAPALNGTHGDSESGVSGHELDVRLIAFYLPQYHPIPENDVWWGKGFTEWTNVTRARQMFAGHYQPHLPADLGFYDLRLPETRLNQAALAREYGISGFCYYHYWFQGKQLLERPFAEVLASGEPNFPFCLCWANEPWSRRWDGSSQDVLQPQKYSNEDHVTHIRSLIPALSDHRAIRVGGRPLFLVYQAAELPDARAFVEIWRNEVARAGLPGIFLVAVETGWDAGWDATIAGFDAKVLFQPQFSILRSVPRLPTDGPDTLEVHSYDAAWHALSNPEAVSYPRYDTVFPGWDNSARKGGQGVVVHGSTPESYELWLRAAIERAQSRPPCERLVFLNAWNEWAEGCHLEPDLRWGRAYLEATKRAVTEAAAIETRGVLA